MRDSYVYYTISTIPNTMEYEGSITPDLEE
jgi:hypothetical protein